jgi:homoserine kinase type II
LAPYTTLSIEDIETILTPYGVKQIHSLKVLSGGSENTNYKVQTEGKILVVTVCELKTKKNATELGQLLEHLAQNNFKTSKIIRTLDNKLLTLWQGKPVMVKSFIKGDILDTLPIDLIALVGAELGRLHKVVAPKYLQNYANFGKQEFKNIKKYAPNSSFDAWLSQNLEYIQPYISPKLPQGLIHADVFSNNVVINQLHNNVVIFDFEEAVNYYSVYDIGMTIIGICAEDITINFEKVSALLKAYQRERKLLDIEINALQAFTVYAGSAMTFWRHSHFNYTKPDPNFFNHYKALQTLTDFIKQQPTDCFIKLAQ